jgi:hypothetical protein
MTSLKAWHPGFVLVGLLVALPLIAAVPLGSTVARVAVTASPLYLYTVGLLVLFAAYIGRSDRWLGWFVAWMGVSLLWTPSIAAFETAETVIMTALAVVIFRTLPESQHGLVVSVLVATGLFQVVDGVQQWLGYDMLWHGLKPITPIPAIFGTTGNPNYYGVFLAMIAPLAPWWAVPFFLLGIVLAHSILGMVAVAVGLVWRVRDNPVLVMGMGIAAVVGVSTVALLKGSAPLSGAYHRLSVWQLALDNLTWRGWLVGAGPGTWAQHVPGLQQMKQLYPNEVFLQGHNEWLQLLYENGLIAVGLLGGWLWSQRAWFTSPYGGAMLAVLVTSLGMFGFRLAMTGCVGIVIIGLATANRRLTTGDV